MLPVTSSSSKPQQIQTEWGTWQSSGQERCGLTYLLYIYIYIYMYVCICIIDTFTEGERLVAAKDGVLGGEMGA